MQREQQVIRWTDEEERILAAMVEAGRTPREICRVLLDRTEDSIRNKANKMGLKFQYKPRIDWDALAEYGITEVE
jgi:hypothetical protein